MVRLKGTFDFGSTGSVVITNDVDIAGGQSDELVSDSCIAAVNYTPKMDTNTGVIIGPRVVRPAAYIPGVATGTIIIKDNEIDVTPENLLKTIGWGVFIAWTTGANLFVTHNVICGAGRAAVGSLDNYLGPDGAGNTLIAHNQITTPTEGFYYPTKCAPNGIMAGWYFNMADTFDPTKSAPVEVSHNKVATNGRWPVFCCATKAAWLHY